MNKFKPVTEEETDNQKTISNTSYTTNCQTLVSRAIIILSGKSDQIKKRCYTTQCYNHSSL